MLNVQNADVYTDFSGLARLKNEAQKESPEALKEVAKQFESIFLNMVLKGMRAAKLADGAMDNDQSTFYRDMYDQQLAIHLSGDPGVGLADLIVKQLSPKDKAVTERMAVEDYLNSPLVRPSLAFRSSQNAEELSVNPFNDEPELLKNEIQPISSAEQFVKQLRPDAEAAAKRLGVDAKVLLAQAALETGWGKSVIKHRNGTSSFNLFNIKAGSTWTGKQAQVATLEFEKGIAKKQKAAFRAYDSYQESFNDYVRLIRNNPRYNSALKHAGNSARYMEELQKAGYATDPHYADKVMRLYHGEDIASVRPKLAVAMQ